MAALKLFWGDGFGSYAEASQVGEFIACVMFECMYVWWFWIVPGGVSERGGTWACCMVMLGTIGD